MRLIDADKLKGKLHMATYQYKPNAVVERPVYFAEDIDDAPTIDAVPVRHGKWIEKEVFTDNKAIGEWQSARCSVCGKYHTTPYIYYFSHYDYCPHCGAMMDSNDSNDSNALNALEMNEVNDEVN